MSSAASYGEPCPVPAAPWLCPGFQPHVAACTMFGLFPKAVPVWGWDFQCSSEGSNALSPCAARRLSVLGSPLFSVVQGQTWPCKGPCLPGVGVWDLRALAGACGISCREGDGRKVSKEEKRCRLCGSPCVSPGLHCPCWVSPRAAGRRGLLPGIPPLLQDFGAACNPHPPHVPGSIVGPCHGAAMGSCGTRCLIRSTLSDRYPCPSREGPACHYGSLYKAAAQQQMIRFPAAFSVPGPAGRAELPRGRSWAEP